MRPVIILLFILVGLIVECTSCRSQINKNQDTFETIWKTVNDTYYDSTFGGLNWNDVHDRYVQLITSVEEDGDFYRMINNMLRELNVSHANLIRPGYMANAEPLLCSEGSPGFDIRIINGEIVITSVKPGSPAKKAGLRPGYLIQAIDDTPVEKIIEEAEMFMRPPYNNSSRIAIITKVILSRVYGLPGMEVSISYSDEKGDIRKKKIMRAKRIGEDIGPKGILFLALDFEADLLDNGIGYIRLNTFQPPLVTHISDAIKSMGNVKGIILDLRGNSGGEIEGMPDLFLNERALLYLSRTRKGETKMFFGPGADAYNGPLVLLIDQLSGSASELFAASLQELERAVVVGERSPGAVMESDLMILPGGAIFMYPVAQIATPEGTVLEGHGVIPDIEVGLNREMLILGIDSQIESAISYLKKPRSGITSSLTSCARR